MKLATAKANAMPTFNFARNTRREYFDVTAPTREQALSLLEKDSARYASGNRTTDLDEEPYELIDMTDEDLDCADPHAETGAV